ncbi:MAG: oligosaccharide flippase family protein [Anaerolineae bacterium]|nr:oligosaccharide flippase family protein [Anaerolineae bacterium]
MTFLKSFLRLHWQTLAILALFFILPLIAFFPQTIGGRTLLPAENLYQYEPYASYRNETGAEQPPPEVPHNHLLSDLVLENVQWKAFILESLREGEIPLWNPHQFSGIPFLASGQQSTLYPFSLLYYILPLPAAYGWFTVLQLWLAGIFMYAFLRGLGIGRTGGAAGGVIYQLSAFFVISAVFPMIIAAAIWLPLLLLMIEFIIRRRPLLRGIPAAAPWVVIGAVALGFCVLAGHVEILYYTLLIAGYYAACRLAWEAWRVWRNPPAPALIESAVGAGFAPPDAATSDLSAPLTLDLIDSATSPIALPPALMGTGGDFVPPASAKPRRALSPLQTVAASGAWLLAMVVLGIGLGAVQFIPLFELASINFRSGSASLEQIASWAHPFRDLLQFILPNFYGSPAQHSYLDVFSGETISLLNNAVTSTDWGMKNYVEAALYLGILPLALSIYALIAKRDTNTPPPYRPIFAVLALFSLTFMFGLPTYALIYLLPGINQLHSPFRWIFALTLCVAVLAAFGLDALAKLRAGGIPHNRRWARMFGWALEFSGALVLAGLLVSRLLFAQIAPIIQRILDNMATASGAPASSVFADPAVFYSVQFPNLLVLGIVLVLSGAVFLWAGRENVPTPDPFPSKGIRRHLWPAFAILLIAADLLIASWGFNPASDPAWLAYTPPAIAWLQAQPGDWRYITLDDPAQRPLFQANMTLQYGLDDARGYESIIPKQYVDFMRQLAPQVQLDYNRVAPLYTVYDPSLNFDPRSALESPLLDQLNIRYVITHLSTDLSGLSDFQRVYSDDAVTIWENLNANPRAMLLTGRSTPEQTAVERAGGTSRESFYIVRTEQPAELVISETFLPGWRAYSLPVDELNNPTAEETELTLRLVDGNFIGVEIPEAGNFQIRIVYSPQSFQVGLFASFISFIILMLVGGVYVWRSLITQPAQGGASGLSIVARNSLAPILLNLFNRGIDFAFAFVMLRILGPEQAGAYFYAGVIFVWFDIFTNFGLNLFLTREVSRDHSKARTYFFNTSAMRIGLAGIGVPMLAAFLGARQATVSPPLDVTTLLAIGLLYVGLLPNSLSNGLTSLYYAFERAEMPALVATVATLSKTIGGLIALLMGWGIVGLAAVSIFTNVVTLIFLWWNARPMFAGTAPARPDFRLMRRMAGTSWPLMLNHFLATIFFQIDVILIEAMHGTLMVGQYQIAYKWVTAINIIPAFFTQAMLPRMSRQARDDKDGLKRNYILAVKLLVSMALPLAVLFTFFAVPLTALLGGSQYLPDGAIATQIMIWSIPIGWMNSFSQYMLVALDLQRKIMRAFVLAVGFNLISNLILIPQYGYQAAAFTTILSEAVLFVPFYLLLRPVLGNMPWFRILWRPVLATIAMIAVMLLLSPVHMLIALPVGILTYAGLWYGLKALTLDEWTRLAPLMPERVRGRLAARAQT